MSEKESIQREGEREIECVCVFACMRVDLCVCVWACVLACVCVSCKGMYPACAPDRNNVIQVHHRLESIGEVVSRLPNAAASASAAATAAAAGIGASSAVQLGMREGELMIAEYLVVYH